MPEYALTMDGLKVDRVHTFPDAPPDYADHSTKGDWHWLAVTRLSAEQGQAAGWTIDLDAGTATHRPEYVAPKPRRVGTFIEFMDLFPVPIQKAIDLAAAPGTDLRLLLMRGQAINKIDLDNDQVKGVVAGLLADSYIDQALHDKIKATDFNNVASPE